MKTLFSSVLMYLLSSAFIYGQGINEAFKSSYENETKGDYTSAIGDIKQVFKEDSYELNVRMGWLHYMSGLFTESMSYYQKAMKLMPFAIEAKFGYVYPAAAVGNWDQVQKCYEDILEIDAKNTIALYRLGSILYGREKYEKAFTNFETVVNLYPFDYDSAIMLAWTNFKLGKTREAKVLFQRVLLISPDDASALEGLALIK